MEYVRIRVVVVRSLVSGEEGEISLLDRLGVNNRMMMMLLYF